MHMQRDLRALGALLTATLLLGAGATHAQADAAAVSVSDTPAGCHWADVSRQEQHLWCPDSAGRYFDTGRVHANVDLPGEAAPAITAPPPGPAPARTAPVYSEQAAARLEQRNKLSGLAQLVDQTIDTDARSWLAWRYDIGSVSGTNVLAWSKDHHPATVYSNYTFNQGRQGWVKISLDRNQGVKCLQFWNETGCRPLGQPESHGLAAGILAGVLSGSGSGSSGDGCQMEFKTQGNDGRPIYGCK
jgi:hypothetical protein